MQHATGTKGVRFAVPADRCAVAEIAATSFELSRLHLDPAYPEENCRPLARRVGVEFLRRQAWRRHGHCRERRRSCCLPARRGSGQWDSHIDLIGCPAGLPPASDLAPHACASHAREIAGAKRLRVATQAANAGSLRFYESLGFRTGC